jgi:hypothetical protein
MMCVAEKECSYYRDDGFKRIVNASGESNTISVGYSVPGYCP